MTSASAGVSFKVESKKLLVRMSSKSVFGKNKSVRITEDTSQGTVDFNLNGDKNQAFRPDI
ncbi:hypothetical protein GCM10008090_04380 [Arenicella chitinivorans]|uniref:Uncharacterized protein n=1 Tax=Arenicella chitinivorans TaxID=1329800 RepID=A0A918RHC6_9GAMM|nr:hypothetical protein GCM10008090_04380 [Arenicella chitinivorans]